MKHPIKGFPLYHFDADKSQISKETKKGDFILKPYKYESGLERVTLYRNHNPYYVFLNNIQVIGDEAVVVQGKKFESISGVTMVPKIKIPTPKKDVKLNESAALDADDANIVNLKTFFDARENKPVRKDAFLKKFSKAVLEGYSEYLNVEKSEGGIYISHK